MSLVAYGSDSDEESAGHSEKLFEALPAPRRNSTVTNVREEDDEFLLKRETPTESPSEPASKSEPRKPVKIVVPSLSSFETEDDAAETRFKKSSTLSGLLKILPEPKKAAPSIKIETTRKLIPYVLSKNPIQNDIKQSSIKLIPRSVDTNTKASNKSNEQKSLISYDSSEDSDETSDAEIDKSNGENDFFSLNKNLDIVTGRNELDSDFMQNGTSASEAVGEVQVQNINTTYDYGSDPNLVQFYESQVHLYQEEEEPNEDSNAQLEDEAVRKLSSSKERRKGETVQFIDINQKEMLPDSREWMTKALTENTSRGISSGKRSGDGPTNQQKRKHQITFLAHQARVNEQDLQNQWAQNRLTRKQTQSKYGF